MAIPNGYTRIEANKLYENVEYYIDTSVRPTSISSNISTTPYLGHSYFGANDTGYLCVVYGVGAVAGSVDTFANTDNGTWLSSVVDGKVNGYPTLNINLEYSPEWLYVKEIAAEEPVEPEEPEEPEKSNYKLIPLYRGSEIQSVKTVNITNNGIHSIVPKDGCIAIESVVVNVDMPQFIDGYILNENDDGTELELVWAKDISTSISYEEAAKQSKQYLESQEV